MTRSQTHTLLIAGTASHVGKSTVAAGLCRLLADRGVDVAPFKAQNMSNNARAVPRATGSGFGEIGVSQYTQARAARVRPTTDHNPVLLKPSGDGESQIVVDGTAIATAPAGEYYATHWEEARAAAADAHTRLTAAADVIVAEGAGSIAEINLHDRDLANIETARMADADVVLVADIERGGVFASLVGTLALLPTDIRERVVGAVITKFRGDRSLLTPGIEAFEDRTGVPVCGVLPFDDPGLPAEDSVDLPAADARSPTIRGDDDHVPAADAITIAVPRLPRLSNATDLEPLAAEPGVRVQYLPIVTQAATDTGRADPFADADAIVIPGTKNTVDDLIALQESGVADAIRKFDGPIVGLCGGYQILGDRILNAEIEGTGASPLSDEGGTTSNGRDTTSNERDTTSGQRSTVEGLGLLPVETVFSHDKRVIETTLQIEGAGPLVGAAGSVQGYEIHMGDTRPTDRVASTGSVSETDLHIPFESVSIDDTADRSGVALGAALGGRSGILGTYLHGLFENHEARHAFLETVALNAGLSAERFRGDAAETGSPYAAAATLVADHVALADLIPDWE